MPVTENEILANKLDFRTAYCRIYNCPEEEFEPRVLAQTLFLHTRVIRAILRTFRPASFYAEYLVVKQAGDKVLLSDVQLDIDFYQHKHVVGHLFRESLNMRLSGRRLIKLAGSVFRQARENSES